MKGETKASSIFFFPSLEIGIFPPLCLSVKEKFSSG